MGDSDALTLGMGLSVGAAKEYDVDESDQGLLGCGIAVGSEYMLHGQVATPGYQCRPEPPTGQVPWPAYWRGFVDTFHPNVVVFLAGRWEVVNRTFQGRWTDILDPAFAVYIRSQLVQAVQVGTAQGARIVFLSAPCFSYGRQPDGQPWPEDDPARVAAYNRLLRQVAAQFPSKVALIDLNAMVCPGGSYRQIVDGVTVRQPDGIHFTFPPGISDVPGAGATPSGGEWLEPKLWPTIVSVGREQMANRLAAT
jgi:hypothetical protein